jgi:hypothetical protein
MLLGLLALSFPVPVAAAYSPGAAAAGTGTTTDPAKGAAGYLARRLVDGTHYVFDFDGKTPDAGLTADGVFGMAAAKASGAALTAATGWLAANASSYIDPAGTFGGPFPGSYAKLALVAEVTGRDPHSVGGIDLLGKLRELECPATGRADCAAAERGLFKNTTKDGGFPNVVTQALAVLALSRSAAQADQPDAAAIDFLVGQQCPNGGFPSLFPAAGAGCVSDVDGTAFGVQALVAVGREGPVGKALDWLTSVRRPDGSFVGNGTPNSNSTAVAVQALVAGGRDASTSISWLRARQQGCGAPAPQRGAVTYAGRYDASALRATTQAAAALAGVPLTTLTATGAESAALVLACAAPPTTAPVPPTTSPAPTASPTTSPTTAPTSPAGGLIPTTPAGNAGPPPSLPATNAVNGSVIRLLAGVGAGLVAAGAAALFLARRRA